MNEFHKNTSEIIHYICNHCQGTKQEIIDRQGKLRHKKINAKSNCGMNRRHVWNKVN